MKSFAAAILAATLFISACGGGRREGATTAGPEENADASAQL